MSQQDFLFNQKYHKRKTVFNRPIHGAFKINMDATAMTVLHLTRMKDNRCDIKVNTYLA